MKESIAKKRYKQHFWTLFMICMNFVDSFELPPTLASCMMMQNFKNLEFFFKSQKSVGIVNEKTSCIFSLLQLLPLSSWVSLMCFDSTMCARAIHRFHFSFLQHFSVGKAQGWGDYQSWSVTQVDPVVSARFQSTSRIETETKSDFEDWMEPESDLWGVGYGIGLEPLLIMAL